MSQFIKFESTQEGHDYDLLAVAVVTAATGAVTPT